MQDLYGRVAVITGAASGIGYAMAERFGEAGMKLVLADIEEPALEEAAAALAARRFEIEAVVTDVSDPAQVDALAARALARFGRVHVICNNAGVVTKGRLWEQTIDDWEWVLAVDLWGVVHGVKTFVPILIDQGDPGHIVNTASINGLLPSPGLGPYNVAKAGVVSLSENLQLDLESAGAPVGVSVLCPAVVATRISTSDRNRPGSLARAPELPAPRPPPPIACTAADVAAAVEHAVREDRFWIGTHPQFDEFILRRAAGIVGGGSPFMVRVP